MQNAIYLYTKADAVADGSQVLLNDLPEMAKLVKDAGFRIPVYLTSGVWNYCAVPTGLEGLQDLAGRVWDVLFLAYIEAARMIRADSYLGDYTVRFQMSPKKSEDVKILIVFNEHEGFTIMLPEDY